MQFLRFMCLLVKCYWAGLEEDTFVPVKVLIASREYHLLANESTPSLLRRIKVLAGHYISGYMSKVKVFAHQR